MNLKSKYSSREKITSNDLKDASREDLLDLLRLVDGDISRITTQINEAKGNAHFNKEYAEPNWFRNASDAKRIKGGLSQLIAFELGRRKRTEKLQTGKINGVSVGSLIRALDIILDSDLKEKIFQRAREFDANPGNFAESGNSQSS